MERYFELVENYKRFREVNRNLNNILFRKVSEKAIRKCGEKLGIMRGGTFVFEDEQEMDVLMDYCIYAYYENGQNAVSQYMDRSPANIGSDEYVVLKAMTESFYTLVQVEQVLKGVGVWANDLLGDRRYPLIDMGLGKTGAKGLVIATRLLPFADFVMTSGAPIPIDPEVTEEILDYINHQFSSENGKYITLDMQQRADLMTTIIRLCLGDNMAAHVRYQDIETPHVLQPLEREARVGRNQPCPCGSGKKYKHCCGR
jgi:hypothetical protein